LHPIRVLRVISDPLDHRVIRVIKGILERWVRKEILVGRDRQVRQDWRQIPELLVHLV
jgi:hypothetical protein